MVMSETVPARVDLGFVRGDNMSRRIRVRDAVQGTYVDFSDYTNILAQVRKSPDGRSVLATFVVAVYDNGPTDRGLSLSLSDTVTATLPPTAVWDLQITDPDGDVRTWLAGVVIVGRDVSRPVLP